MNKKIKNILILILVSILIFAYDIKIVNAADTCDEYIQTYAGNEDPGLDDYDYDNGNGGYGIGHSYYVWKSVNSNCEARPAICVLAERSWPAIGGTTPANTTVKNYLINDDLKKLAFWISTDGCLLNDGTFCEQNCTENVKFCGLGYSFKLPSNPANVSDEQYRYTRYVSNIFRAYFMDTYGEIYSTYNNVVNPEWGTNLTVGASWSGGQRINAKNIREIIAKYTASNVRIPEGNTVSIQYFSTNSDEEQDFISWSINDTPVVTPKGGFKIIKSLTSTNTLTSDEKKNAYKKFKFEIYEGTSVSGTPKATLTLNENSGEVCYGFTNNSSCSGDYTLTEGAKYTIKEIITNSNGSNWEYVSGNTTITIAGNQTIEVPYVNTENKGAIKIKKEFISGSEEFSKFKFKIEKKNSSNNWETVATDLSPNDENGYLCYGYTEPETCSGAEKLNIGDEYRVTEVLSGDMSYKWVPIESSITFPIMADSQKENGIDGTIKNRRKYYCVAVKKVDAEDENTVLNGVTFELDGTYQLTGEPYNNGIAYFNYLEYKDYTLQEKEAKEGYFNDNPETISVFKNELTEMTYENGKYVCPESTVKTYTKKDHKKYYCIKVIKVDAVTKDPLPGASFKTTINEKDVEHADNWDGSNDGYTTFFTGTQNDNFTLTETVAPKGYSKYENTRKAITFELPKELSSSEAQTECQKIKCTYDKTSDKSTCRYTPQNSTTDTINGDIIKTDVDAIPTFPNSKNVVNWYKETDDGTMGNGAEFVVSTSVNNSTKYVKTNGTASRKDENGVTKTCYVFDSLVNSQNDATTLKSMNTNTNGSTSNGEFCIVGVEKSTKYTAIETKPLEYHTFGSAISKEVTSSNVYASKNDSNKFVNYKTVFTFTKKVSSGDETTTLKNITTAQLKKIPFEVYKLDSNGKITGSPLSFIKTADGVYENAANSMDLPSGTSTTELYLNDSRNITIYHLAYGDYGIIEKGSPTNGNTCTCDGNTCTGFYSPNNSQASTYKFTISNCSNANANAQKCTSHASATQELTNIPTEIKFTKSDFYSYEDPTDTVKFENDEEVKAFDKIKFKIYTKNSNGTKNYLSLVKTSGTCESGTSTSIYRYVPSDLPSDLTSGLTTTTDLYTCNGNIKITNLCRGQKYYIEEVEVPANTVFTLPETEAARTVEYNIPCCGDTTTSTTTTKAVINDKPTRVVIYKLDSRTNDKVDDETTTFKVYQCKSTVSKCTSSNGTLVHFTSRAKITGDQEDENKEVYKFAKNNTGGVTALHPYKGEVIIRYLPAGYKYVAVETVAPKGYYNPTNANNSTEFTVKTNTVNVPITNVSNDYTRIFLNKTDIYGYYTKADKAKIDSNDKLLDSAKFVLRDENGAIMKLRKIADGEYRYIPVTSANTIEKISTYNGSLKITHLERGKKYYIEEVETTDPEHFILPTNVKKPSGIPSGWSWKGHPYVIYNVPDNLPSNESVTELIANQPTRVVFHKTDKRTGELILDEKTTFEIYQCAKTVTTCTKTNGTKVFFSARGVITDDNEDSGKEVYKYAKLNSGSVSQLHPYNGELIIRYLPADYKYVLVETNAPDGYYNPKATEEETEFTVLNTTVSENQDYEILTDNVVNTPTEIIFIKKDFYKYYSEADKATLESDVKLFDTAKFYLRDSDGNILKLTKVGTNDEEGNVYKYEKGKGNVTKINTYKGKLKVINLIRSSEYYIEEIETTDPANLVLLNENITYDYALPFDNKGHQVVKYTLPETEPADKSSITREISNKPTRIRFEKRDSKYGYLIPDETATFKVYQCKANTECHPSDYATDEERKAAGITLINFEARTVISGDEEDITDAAGVSGVEVYKYKKLNASGITELHPYHGILVLRYLPAGYNYVLLETVAPVNYLLPIGRDAEFDFTVSSETVETKEIDMPNVPTALLIRKYGDDGSLLEGAEFKIYEGTTCDANLSAMNQPKTLLKLKTIRDGVYENRPVADTDIIQTCSDKNGTCKNIPVNETTKLTYTDFIGTWSDFSELLNTEKESVELQQGEILVQYLEYNHCYIIEEVKAPKGYSLPKKDEDRFTMVTIEENEQYAGDTYKQLINKPTPFTFYKYDEYGNPLDGAEFKLQVLDDNKKYQDVTVTKEEVNGEFFYKADENSTNKTITTKDGKATVYYLPAGQYRILETKAAPGKELSKNANIATFFVDDSGNVYGNSIIVNKAKTEKQEIKGSSSAELIIAPRTGQVVIKYGLIIALLVAAITGLMILVKKTK